MGSSITQRKVSALRRVVSEVMAELDEAEKKAASPVPANRLKKKEKRIENIAAFYLKRKIS